MGISILELVLRTLRGEGLAADLAYPGQRSPAITGPVAAVHLKRVDRSRRSVTVEVLVLSPARLGGTACEVAALRATEGLKWAGADCVQGGCVYDGTSQVYQVAIQAEFSCVIQAEECAMGPGFRVYVGSNQMIYTVSFTAEQVLENKMHYEMGETAPVDSSAGSWVWQIRLEEMIPGGKVEPLPGDEFFNLRVENDDIVEVYFGCRWTSVRREYTAEGLRRIRCGIAALREEVKDG